MRKILVLTIWLIAVCSALYARDTSGPSAKFYEANLLYKQGNYEKAVASYEEILDRGIASGSLYYNLGNGYLKLHQIGKAILCYERAKLFFPRDPDLQANLDYALSLSKVPAGAPEISFLRRMLMYYQDALTTREMMWITVGLCLITGIIVFIAEIFQLSIGKRWAVIGSLIILLIGQGALWANKSHMLRKAAVVLEDAQARFEPNDQGTQHFYVAAGEKISILRVEGRWAKIRRADGKLGWVKISELEKVIGSKTEQKEIR